MRADELIPTLTEIQRRWLYHRIRPNVGPVRPDFPWYALLVWGDLGPVDGHECVVYDRIEGCVADGHENYQLVAWIDHMGRAHYQSEGDPK